MPLPSPTTTRAVKLNRRPPLTTLATRLMVTTCSRYAVCFSAWLPRRSSRRSRRSPPPLPPRRGAPGISGSFRNVRNVRNGADLGGRTKLQSCSQLEATFTCTVGDGGDPAMVLVAAAVEDHGADAGGLGPLREQLADLARLGGLVALGALDGTVERGGLRQRMALGVVDDLREHMPRGPVDDQPRPARAAGYLLPDPQMPPDAAGRALAGAGPHATGGPGERPGLCASHDLLTSLPDLAADDLALVPHALALVRVRLAELADARGHLADELLIDALDDEPGRRLDAERDALRRTHGHRVAEAEGELQVLALCLHAVTDANDLQGLGVALRDAGHHIGDQRAGQPVERPDRAFVVRPGDPDDAIFPDDLDGLGDRLAERALGALDLHIATIDGDVDAAGDGDGEPSDSRHDPAPPVTRRRRGLRRPRRSCWPACRSSGRRTWR